MSASSQILLASVGGSVELLTLCCAGAILTHAGLFSRPVSSSMSKATYQVFIPALAFGSILENIHSSLEKARTSTVGNPMQHVWIPVLLAFITFLVSALIAFPLTFFLAQHKQEAVRRAMFACLILGNANSIPLLVLQSLCDTFEPLQEGGECYATSMGYATLFMTVINMIAWTALFQYIMYSPDSSVPTSDEEQGLILHVETDTHHHPHSHPAPKQYSSIKKPLLESEDSVKRLDTVNKSHQMSEAITRALFSPPFLTAIFAVAIALIPGVANCFLDESGILRPFLMSFNVLGNVVVPISCMIVGSELYRSIFMSNTETNHETRPDETFGTQGFVGILLVRLIILPFLGRLAFTALDLRTTFNNPLLGVFSLVETGVPTANNTVLMITIAADGLPRIGKQLRQDVSKCIFLQFLATPIFLTFNTAAALSLQYQSVQ